MKVVESKKGENVVEIHFAKYEMKLLDDQMKKRNLSLVKCFQFLIKEAFVWYMNIER